MRIHLYSVQRNERFILQYWLRHYSQFCERIVIYDDDSNDGSRELMKSYPQVEIRKPEWTGIDDERMAALYNECYKESRGAADYVIEVDADEFIYHPNLINVLKECKKPGYPVIRCEGWQMLSEDLPNTEGQIYEQIKKGIRDDCLSKHAVFDPKVAIYQQIGRHYAKWDGPMNMMDKTGIKLLHYRFLSRDYVKAKHAQNADRLTQNNRQHCWGTHNCDGWTGHQSLHWYEEKLKGRVEAI